LIKISSIQTLTNTKGKQGEQGTNDRSFMRNIWYERL